MGRRPNPNGRQRPLVTRVYPGQQSFSIAQAAALTGRHPSTIQGSSRPGLFIRRKRLSAIVSLALRSNVL